MRFTTSAAALLLAAPTFAAGEPNGTLELDAECTEFDRYEVLTPNDTLTLLTSDHNPEQGIGFAVVHVVDEAGEPIARDVLAGNLLAINGIETVEWSVNAVDFRSPVEDGGATDLDGDGVRDLDGAEYETAPDELLVPRFIGQSQYVPNGEAAYQGLPFQGVLVLLDLNSGRAFDTTVDFLSYNDNEEVFSSEYTFDCWDSVPLVQISGAFTNDFLSLSTSHDPDESLAGRETGWFRFEGHVANSTAASLADPAIYGVYVESVGGFAAADLPFESGSRVGHLLPRTILGDNSEGSAPAGGLEPVTRRRPGSLLVYPAFNNLHGELTLFTVTNTSPEHEVRVHFVYYGKVDLTAQM